jgi:hypothetical protein
MKTKLAPYPQKTDLLHPFKYASVALAAAAGMILAGQAQAQPVTGTPTLSNVPAGLTSLYGDWAGNTSVSAAGFTVSTTDTGGGSSYYQIPVANRQTLNVNDTEAVLTFTVNDGNSQGTVWTGVPFYLNDTSGAYQVGGYVGEYGYNGTQSPGSATWSGATTNICTEIAILPAALVTAIQAGGDSINGINLEFYPAVYPADGSGGYNVTFNSLILQPVGGFPSGSPNITSYQYNSATSFTLTWASQASAQYTVQYSTDLTAGFTALQANIASGGTTTSATVTIPAGQVGFFRILQQ